ncbi:MAG TPA: amidohydrolase family protein [Gemmatimonadaceae bacterium]|nr:amidohydrolase family protein [Gemmatimonadaceae bacterium]
MSLPNVCVSVRLGVIAILAGCAAPRAGGVAPSPRAAPFDVILRGGTVLDGTGGQGVRADVGVLGARIAKVGDLSRDSGVVVIDATGLVVAPGFINIHSHASPAAWGAAANMLKQGVTTEILSPDGGGLLDVGAGLAAIDTGVTPAVNLGAYAPFNTAWEKVVGQSDRRPTPEQIAQVTALLARGLEAGAWGVSAGLDYKPAYYAKTDEVVAVLSPLREWRTNFPNHDRLTPEKGFSSVEAARETIEIGERAGLVPVITHMKLQGKDQGKVEESLAMMRAATARGVYTAADVYPYLAGQTALSALFVPGWAQDGGRDSLVSRLRDSSVRARIIRETDEAYLARVGRAENVRVLGRNRTIAEYMTEQGTKTPGEAIARILETESPGMIATFGAEPDLVKLLQYPDVAVACDCGASRNPAHPRGSGSFPRVLGHYVRETRALPLADAVRKMSGLPATIIGMVDRGFIAVGMMADIAVFDPATVIDRATYEQPLLPPVGVRHVLVNGRVALRDGEPTGTAAGKTLRRTRGMPSRPMKVVSSPSVELKRSGSDAAGSVTVDLARRVVRVTTGSETAAATALGIVQTGPRWASVTGMLAGQGGFTLIVDDAARQITLQIDGQASRAFSLR